MALALTQEYGQGNSNFGASIISSFDSSSNCTKITYGQVSYGGYKDYISQDFDLITYCLGLNKMCI